MTQLAPSDMRAEAALLGGALVDSEIAALAEELPAEEFYRDAHARIWEAVRQLHKRGEPVDSVSVRGVLADAKKLQAVGGDDYLLHLTGADAVLPTVALAEEHAERIRRLAHARRLMIEADKLRAEWAGGVEDLANFLDRAESALISAASQRDANEAVSWQALVESTYDSIRVQAESKRGLVGVPTGFRKLDEHTAGFEPDQLIIVAGRPGMGKTAMGVRFAVQAATSGHPVAFASLEMNRRQLGQRYLAGEAAIGGMRLRKAQLSQEDWQTLSMVTSSANLPIEVDDRPARNVLDLRRLARRVQRKHGRVGMVVVDYLQLMRAVEKHRSREEEIAEVSRSLKALSKSLHVPVIALAQLNRDVEKRGARDKRPQLSDLRESGAIEQDADTILFLYRDEVYNPGALIKLRDGREVPNDGIAEIVIGKQRQGPTGLVRVRWSKDLMRFEELDGRPDDFGSYDE